MTHVSEEVELHIDTGGKINEFEDDEARLAFLARVLSGEAPDGVDVTIESPDGDADAE